DRAVEHMVEAFVFLRLFHRHQVRRLFDDADLFPLAARVATDAALRPVAVSRDNLAQAEAGCAKPELALEARDAFGQRLDFVAALLQKVKRKTAGGLLPDARELR